MLILSLFGGKLYVLNELTTIKCYIKMTKNNLYFKSIIFYTFTQHLVFYV